ncbi:hypothetical protein KY290_019368 [Solanum tuberosum]|uniref:Transposase MuDR plant domain-containing protein n=1 Tax=Solanum tuberosum TaxID=4113 RepID=A0ABQ7VGT3_SOLTU|nr:hypothetical protein KY284_018322 [Solanum tuberosum]KAH0763295.1 hypothetical protein KY290_019368 [Solanum tuberosum]
MDEIIFTKIYHGGILSEISVPTYVGNCVLALSVDVDFGEKGEAVNLGGEGEAVDLGGEGGESVDDNLGGEGESDFLGSDSDLDIPSEDAGEAGGIDRGFEDIGKNKTDKYAGKLGGNEDYIDSSDCWSDDSAEQLDVDAVRGVDIPVRRRSKKVRYDEDCEVSIFELGMVFEGANQFRKAVADYAVEYRRQIKLRPNEKHRVRVKCKNANCHKRPYSSASFAAATGGNIRPTTGFGVYPDPTTGAQVFNPGTLSEKILHGPTKLKSASPINIDIDFKPRSLKWKGKDAVGTSQLQQMKANRKNWK